MEWMTCHYLTVQNGNWEIGEILSRLCIIVFVNILQCVDHHHVWLLTIVPCLVRAWFFLALGGQWTFAYLPFANPTSLLFHHPPKPIKHSQSFLCFFYVLSLLPSLHFHFTSKPNFFRSSCCSRVPSLRTNRAAGEERRDPLIRQKWGQCNQSVNNYQN